MSAADRQLPSISAIIVLDQDGKAIASKYYQKSCTDIKAQHAFEKKLYQKTCRTNAKQDAEVLLFEKYVVLYKFVNDVIFYVCAPAEENELIVLSVLNCLEESLHQLLRNQVSKRTLNDYDIACLMLTIDEIVDEGLLLELDSSMVISRVAMRDGDNSSGPQEQTFSQAFLSAKDQLVKTFRT